jgi:hypothetical protein
VTSEVARTSATTPYGIRISSQRPLTTYLLTIHHSPFTVLIHLPLSPGLSANLSWRDSLLSGYSPAKSSSRGGGFAGTSSTYYRIFLPDNPPLSRPRRRVTTHLYFPNYETRGLRGQDIKTFPQNLDAQSSATTLPRSAPPRNLLLRPRQSFISRHLCPQDEGTPHRRARLRVHVPQAQID